MEIFKKEKAARKLVMEHSSAVLECLVESRRVLETYMTGVMDTVDSNAVSVSKLESRCDELKFEIRDALNRGAFLPMIRADVYSLVESVDYIAGEAEDVTKFVTNQFPEIPEQFRTDFLDIFDASIACYVELREAMKAFFKPKGQIESLHDHGRQVSILETEVDNLERHLIRKIFRSDLDLSHKMHLHSLISVIANIADHTEDVSDELETSAMRTII